jgi:hypothetical protein
MYFYVTMANYLCVRDLPDGQPYGLVNDDMTPRKSYEAFQKVANELRLESARRPLGKGSGK